MHLGRTFGLICFCVLLVGGSLAAANKLVTHSVYHGSSAYMSDRGNGCNSDYTSCDPNGYMYLFSSTEQSSAYISFSIPDQFVYCDVSFGEWGSAGPLPPNAFQVSKKGVATMKGITGTGGCSWMETSTGIWCNTWGTESVALFSFPSFTLTPLPKSASTSKCLSTGFQGWETPDAVYRVHDTYKNWYFAKLSPANGLTLTASIGEVSADCPARTFSFTFNGASQNFEASTSLENRMQMTRALKSSSKSKGGRRLLA